MSLSTIMQRAASFPRKRESSESIGCLDAGSSELLEVFLLDPRFHGDDTVVYVDVAPCLFVGDLHRGKMLS